MKNLWKMMVAALVIIGATACTESEEGVDKKQGQSAGVSFYATIGDDTTRAYIDDADGDKTWSTVWEEGDTLVVSDDTYAGYYTFVCTDATTGKFTCSDSGAVTLVGKKVIIRNDYDKHKCDSRLGKKALSVWTTGVEFTPDATIQLSSDTSFFRYTYEGEGDVTLKLTLKSQMGNDINAFRDNGNYVDEITFSGIKGENFVPFWCGIVSPEQGVNATLSYAIDGVIAKQTTIKNISVGKVYNLGTHGKSEYGVVGSFQAPTTWDVAAPVTMQYDGNWVVAKGIELYKSDEFKIVKGNSWDVNFGGKDAVLVAEANTEYTLAQGGQNIHVNKNGKFDIYFNPTSSAFKYTCVEEYTDLAVFITIDNKANWSPLYITLKAGDTVIADNEVVTDNKFEVSGDYIGETLTCTLSDGTKTSEEMNVAITKSGATVTLEETVIKLKVQLNTANAKQWWGNTMKIHVWNTGTSFDTSWPGNTMTSEGNYTWSIIVPSELVGKTINFLVHNGNGWQSSDSKVTISAEGNTITGSSIGIN